MFPTFLFTVFGAFAWTMQILVSASFNPKMIQLLVLIFWLIIGTFQLFWTIIKALNDQIQMLTEEIIKEKLDLKDKLANANAEMVEAVRIILGMRENRAADVPLHVDGAGHEQEADLYN